MGAAAARGERRPRMNLDNIVHLVGTIEGACWSRWKSKERGSVRFWLAVSRELAGDGVDRLLCAIEPHSADEVWRLERELTAGRTVRLEAQARQAAPDVNEAAPGVVFVAECCGLDGADPRSAHNLGRRAAAHGKLAAAGDVEQAELLALEEVRR